jgi:hypothetical protein
LDRRSKTSLAFPNTHWLITPPQNIAGKEEEWEKLGKIPDDIYQKCAKAGLLVPIAFGHRIPAEWGHYPIAAGIKASEWDGFHDFILWDELFRGAPSISSVFIGLVSIVTKLITFIKILRIFLGCWCAAFEAICLA